MRGGAEKKQQTQNDKNAVAQFLDLPDKKQFFQMSGHLFKLTADWLSAFRP
jgi:hypothetical protein